MDGRIDARGDRVVAADVVRRRHDQGRGAEVPARTQGRGRAHQPRVRDSVRGGDEVPAGTAHVRVGALIHSHLVLSALALLYDRSTTTRAWPPRPPSTSRNPGVVKPMDPTWLVRLDQTLSSYSILIGLLAVVLAVGLSSTSAGFSGGRSGQFGRVTRSTIRRGFRCGSGGCRGPTGGSTSSSPSR